MREKGKYDQYLDVLCKFLGVMALTLGSLGLYAIYLRHFIN